MPLAVPTPFPGVFPYLVSPVGPDGAVADRCAGPPLR